MFDHVGIAVKDLARSVAFYEKALAPLGYVLCNSDAGGAGFGPKGAPALWLSPAKGSVTAAHVAFKAKERRSVEAFHAAGLAAGGRDNGPAGLRPDYGPSYFAAFILDPDGNNVEAVCLT